MGGKILPPSSTNSRLPRSRPGSLLHCERRDLAAYVIQSMWVDNHGRPVFRPLTSHLDIAITVPDSAFGTLGILRVFGERTQYSAVKRNHCHWYQQKREEMQSAPLWPSLALLQVPTGSHPTRHGVRTVNIQEHFLDSGQSWAGYTAPC